MAVQAEGSMKKLTSTILLLILLGGCSPRMFNTLFMAAAFVGTAAILAHHDAHFHDHHCGHPYRWVDGRWVYYYHYHWEYYDPELNAWYYYEE